MKFSVILLLPGIARTQLFCILELLKAQHPENALSDQFLAAFLKSDPERCLIHHCPKRELLAPAQRCIHFSLLLRCTLRKAALFATADVTFRLGDFLVLIFLLLFQWFGSGSSQN